MSLQNHLWWYVINNMKSTTTVESKPDAPDVRQSKMVQCEQLTINWHVEVNNNIDNNNCHGENLWLFKIKWGEVCVTTGRKWTLTALASRRSSRSARRLLLQQPRLAATPHALLWPLQFYQCFCGRSTCVKFLSGWKTNHQPVQLLRALQNVQVDNHPSLHPMPLLSPQWSPRRRPMSSFTSSGINF